MTIVTENKLCRECHGNYSVEAKCACGCGKVKEITCTHCNGHGVEPVNHLHPLFSAGLTWVQEKLAARFKK